MERLIEFASSVPEFRRTGKGNHRHRHDDIIMPMIFGRTCGCVGRADIIEFGKLNINRIRKMGMLENGVPSEATLRRVDNGIDDLAMAEKMQEFVGVSHAELCGICRNKEIICIDGKAECGTVIENGRNPNIVSAYSFNTGVTPATEACQEKNNGFSRNLVGIRIQVCNTEQKKLLAGNAPEVSPEQFDFGIEGFRQSV